MLIKKMFLTLGCLFFLVHCAGHRLAERHAWNSWKDNSIPVYRTGLIVKEEDDGLRVVDFENEFPGKTAGMQIGDVIVSVDGKKLSKKELATLMNLNRGEEVLFTVWRHGLTLDYRVTPQLYFILPPSMYKIYELLDVDEQRVRLAVVVTEVKDNTGRRSYPWEESMRLRVQGALENRLLNNLGTFDSFSLADKSRLNKILDDYRLDMTGLTSDDARARIGNMTGATHLLVATVVRYQGTEQNGSCEDNETTKLLEIKSGRTLAVDQSIQGCR